MEGKFLQRPLLTRPLRVVQEMAGIYAPGDIRQRASRESIRPVCVRVPRASRAALHWRGRAAVGVGLLLQAYEDAYSGRQEDVSDCRAVADKQRGFDGVFGLMPEKKGV